MDSFIFLITLNPPYIIFANLESEQSFQVSTPGANVPSTG